MVDTQNGTTAAGPTVGFLGLGIMGHAMAANLLNSGKFPKVVVWNRTLSKVRGLTTLQTADTMKTFHVHMFKPQ
jgi:3-hydroxyisobutyrate dehydrogenase-like beta-hydroxyacid dehydrogenase